MTAERLRRVQRIIDKVAAHPEAGVVRWAISSFDGPLLYPLRDRRPRMSLMGLRANGRGSPWDGRWLKGVLGPLRGSARWAPARRGGLGRRPEQDRAAMLAELVGNGEAAGPLPARILVAMLHPLEMLTVPLLQGPVLGASVEALDPPVAMGVSRDGKTRADVTRSAAWMNAWLSP